MRFSPFSFFRNGESVYSGYSPFFHTCAQFSKENVVFLINLRFFCGNPKALFSAPVEKRVGSVENRAFFLLFIPHIHKQGCGKLCFASAAASPSFFAFSRDRGGFSTVSTYFSTAFYFIAFFLRISDSHTALRGSSSPSPRFSLPDCLQISFRKIADLY